MARSESGRKSKSPLPVPEIPDKLYFRIGEAARLLALPAYVLRFWETEFPHVKPNKGGTGQRLYRRRDVEALVEIRRLLYDEGYTIPGARQFLNEKARATEPALPLEPSEHERTQAAATLAHLRKIQTELRGIAQVLGSPVAGQPAAKPAHRGLHLTAQKQAVRDQQAALFIMPGNSSSEEPGDQ